MSINPELFDGEPVTIANVGAGMCRYPTDHEPSAEMRLCGAPCDLLEPYCPEHRKICWTVAPKKREHVHV